MNYQIYKYILTLNFLYKSIQACTKFCDGCGLSHEHLVWHVDKKRMLTSPIVLDGTSYYCVPYSWSNCLPYYVTDDHSLWTSFSYYVNFHPTTGPYKLEYMNIPRFHDYLQNIIPPEQQIATKTSISMSDQGKVYYEYESAGQAYANELIHDGKENVHCLQRRECTKKGIQYLEKQKLCLRLTPKQVQDYLRNLIPTTTKTTPTTTTKTTPTTTTTRTTTLSTTRPDLKALLSILTEPTNSMQSSKTDNVRHMSNITISDIHLTQASITKLPYGKSVSFNSMLSAFSKPMLNNTSINIYNTNLLEGNNTSNITTKYMGVQSSNSAVVIGISVCLFIIGLIGSGIGLIYKFYRRTPNTPVVTYSEVNQNVQI